MKFGVLWNGAKFRCPEFWEDRTFVKIPHFKVSAQGKEGNAIEVGTGDLCFFHIDANVVRLREDADAQFIDELADEMDEDVRIQDAGETVKRLRDIAIRLESKRG